MQSLGKKQSPLLGYSIIATTTLVYFQFAYFTVREDFTIVISLSSLLFASFIYLLKFSQLSFKQLSGLALLFRIILIAAIPNLSQDFYRFIWDGRMLWEGLNPYLTLPQQFVQGDQALIIDEAQRLYEGMGSLNGSHYTCYPPINQLGFLIPAFFFSKSLLGSTIIMRSLIIAADIGTWWIGQKLLDHLKLDRRNIFFYILNPFIIIELSGNLHFEGVMIFFLLWAVYLLLKGKWQWSALVMALSISVKLIPLLFLPVFLRKLGFKKAVGYYLITGGVTAALFAPFITSAFVQNFMSSINLYFQNFEFNASIYYIIRAIGYEVTGYNIIQKVGRVLPLVVVFCIMLVSLLRKNEKDKTLISSLMWSLGIYYLLATTIHPWYVAVILSLSIFTTFRFALVWSFTIILSYTAYANETYQENLALIVVEYVLVIGYLVYEFWKRKRFKNQRNISAAEHS